ncbi:hypothetical protein BC937DRAFT_92619 [Endogone sp. FLAS-F59071]|nr:hypothetical protein BC937DRAFT_92619 [Endogone sp. FLAS-F59071]|eukprot:RUS21463.1 hypothetical protein BC937DRAFT_92619 [Endogone sp. FLAS-F59071]
MQLRPRSNTPYPEDRLIQRPRKRPKSPEEYEQLPTSRARKKYISENIASELAALSLRSAAEGGTTVLPEATMEDAFDSNRASRTGQSRHTVVVNDLNDSDTASDEEDGYANHGLPMDRRPGAKPKIPEHILKSPQDLNPVRTLVLYSPPVWQSPLAEATEKFNDNESKTNDSDFNPLRRRVIEKTSIQKTPDVITSQLELKEDEEIVEMEIEGQETDFVEDVYDADFISDEDDEMELTVLQETL